MHTTDPEEAWRTVSAVFVPHEVTVDGALDARLNVARSDRVTFGYLTYGAETTLEVPPLTDCYHLNLTLTGRTRVRHGRDETATHGAVGAMFSPFEPSTVTWSADAAQFAIKLPRTHLEAHLSALLHDVVPRPPRFAVRVGLRGPAGRGLLAAAKFFAQQAGAQTCVPELQREQWESFLLTQVLLGVPNTYSRALRTIGGSAGRYAVEQAIDYIEAHPGRPLGGAVLASVAGTSAAALRRAFLREVGMTPAEYVRRARAARPPRGF
ncbi:cupin domain-containing protein [Amycolatopsis thermophila]|nr:AraC family transcriptional regulator [Amycolatopsis thermophila]